MNIFKQNYTKYGLAMVGLTMLCLSLMELTGKNESFSDSALSPAFTIVAPFIVWFMGIYHKRKDLKNKMTFKQGFVEGFKISLVFAIVSPFIFAAYYIAINPNILDTVRVSYNLGEVSDTVVMLVDMGVQFVSAIIFGSIYSAIIAFILKARGKK